MVTLQELRQKQLKLIEENSGGGKSKGSSEFARFPQEGGDNWIRILPGKSDELEFFSESAVHKFVDDNGEWSNYNCRKVQHEACPVCDFYFDLWKRHKELKLPKGEKSKFGDMATMIKSKPRFFVRAVIRALQAAGEDPVKYVAMSKELFDRVIAAVTNPDLSDEDDPDNTTIISLERGNDFNVKITKKGVYNSFVESEPKIKKTKAGTPQEMLAWMESPLDPKLIVKIGDYEEGKKLVMNLEARLSGVKVEGTSEAPFDVDDDDKFKKGLKV